METSTASQAQDEKPDERQKRLLAGFEALSSEAFKQRMLNKGFTEEHVRNWLELGPGAQGRSAGSKAEEGCSRLPLPLKVLAEAEREFKQRMFNKGFTEEHVRNWLAL